MRLGDFAIRAVFAVVTFALALLAAALFAYACAQVFSVVRQPEGDVGSALLDAVGYTIISLAVFEVAKYLFEEEVIDPSEMRYAHEARRGITKFLTTIIIAVFLEALVSVFVTSKEDPALMLYPILLLFAGVATVVGLGAYQRLSASAEKTLGPAEQDSENERKVS